MECFWVIMKISCFFIMLGYFLQLRALCKEIDSMKGDIWFCQKLTDENDKMISMIDSEFTPVCEEMKKIIKQRAAVAAEAEKSSEA